MIKNNDKLRSEKWGMKSFNEAEAGACISKSNPWLHSKKLIDSIWIGGGESGNQCKHVI